MSYYAMLHCGHAPWAPWASCIMLHGLHRVKLDFIWCWDQLQKQLLSWPNSTNECEAMTCWAKGPRCASTKPFSCRLSFMAASRGQPTPDKGGDSTDSTSAAFGACCKSGGRTESPTPRSWRALAHWACHHCSFSDASDGSAMHIAMEPDCLPREILYGELWEGICRVGQPLLRYKDVIKRDLRSALIDTSAWEDIAKHQDTWQQSVKARVSKAEANARVQATCKRAARKEHTASMHDSTRHVCTTCNRDFHSRIGLHSHTRSCPNPHR